MSPTSKSATYVSSASIVFSSPNMSAFQSGKKNEIDSNEEDEKLLCPLNIIDKVGKYCQRQISQMKFNFIEATSYAMKLSRKWLEHNQNHIKRILQVCT